MEERLGVYQEDMEGIRLPGPDNAEIAQEERAAPCGGTTARFEPYQMGVQILLFALYVSAVYEAV